MLPSLGFGTAPALGRVGRRRSLEALALAYASGIRHFDTARSYGWGECESLLGDFLQGCPREDFTIVTKCGLSPIPQSTLLSVAKAFARQVAERIPGTLPLIRRVAASAGPTSSYDVATLRASVETSLRKLRMDYLDVLLLHNFEPGKVGFAEVLALFRELRDRGTIRRFGVSLNGSLLPALEYLRASGALPESVVQVAIGDELFSLDNIWSDVTFFVHSPFRYLGEPHAAAATFASLIEELSISIRCEVVITSMFSPEHLQHNVEMVSRVHRAVVFPRSSDSSGG